MSHGERLSPRFNVSRFDHLHVPQPAATGHSYTEQPAQQRTKRFKQSGRPHIWSWALQHISSPLAEGGRGAPFEAQFVDPNTRDTAVTGAYWKTERLLEAKRLLWSRFNQRLSYFIEKPNAY